mgnify:CR=1 FL=1
MEPQTDNAEFFIVIPHPGTTEILVTVKGPLEQAIHETIAHFDHYKSIKEGVDLGIASFSKPHCEALVQVLTKLRQNSTTSTEQTN